MEWRNPIRKRSSNPCGTSVRPLLLQCRASSIRVLNQIAPLLGSGYKFDSGALRNRTTGEVVRTMTEKDVFRKLKLDWIRKSSLGCSIFVCEY